MKEYTGRKKQQAKDRISNLNDKVAENIQSEQQNEKRIFKNEDSLRDLKNNMKHNNICFTGASERGDRKRLRTYLRNSDQKFPKW